jgi:hypothetical protein
MFDDIDRSINGLCDLIIAELVNLSRNFKWLVNCFMLESSEANCASDSVSYWDEQLDGYINLEFKKDKFILRVVIYCLAV